MFITLPEQAFHFRERPLKKVTPPLIDLDEKIEFIQIYCN